MMTAGQLLEPWPVDARIKVFHAQNFVLPVLKQFCNVEITFVDVLDFKHQCFHVLLL